MPVSTQQNIDLSTGQITFPVQLLTVPGPQGLDIQVGAVYSSAIASQVTIWNEDAPTGILGLGWSLPYPHILRGSPGAYTGTQDPFYLIDNDLYELLPAGTSGTDFLFTCDPYQDWQIRYTPTSEQWTIIKEDGTTYFFGGDLPPEQNRKHMLDAPNSIEWGLRWGNQIGNGQQATSPNVPVQYAVAWHLKTVQTISGQQMVFSYSQELGQINSVSLHYTQAIYLTSIQTVPGSATVTFMYKNKSPNEYPTPRAAPGGVQFNAYQQKYETRYLSSLEVVHTSGVHLFTVTLDYTMLNSGNMQKRLLRSLVRTNPAGQVYDPGYLFHYYDEADQVSVMLADSSHMFNTTTNALYGALSGVTLPEGAKVTYQYAQVTLQNTERRLQVGPPASTGWSSPRVYFGPDYTVVTWYNTAQQQLALTAYQWQGSWVLQDFGTISANTNLVQISIGPEFFALLTPGTTNAIQLYHKDRRCFGRWLTQAIPASIMATSTCKAVVGELVYAVLEVTSSKAGQVYQYAWNGTTWVAPTQNPLSLDTPGKAFYDLAASTNYTIAITARPDNSRQPFIIRSVYRLDTLNWDTPLQKTVDNFFAPAGRNQYITSSTTQYGVDNLIALASPSFAVFRASSSAMYTTMGEQGSIVTFSAEYRHFFYRWPTDAPEQWTELQAITMANLPQMPDIKPTLYTTENSILILQNTVKYIYHLNGQSLTMQNLSNNFLNNDPRAAIAGLDMTFSISQSLPGQNYYTLYQYDQNTTQWTPQPNVTLPDQYDMEYLLTVLIPTVTAMLDLLFMAVPVGELLGTFMAEVLNLAYTVASTALPLCLMRALVQNALALRGLRYLAVGSKGDSGKQIYTRDPISAWGPISNPFLTNTTGNLADDVFDLTDTFALFPISDNNNTSLHMFFLRNGTVCGQTVLEPGGQYSVHPSADQQVVSSPGVVLAYPQSAGSLEQAQSFCLYQVFEQLVSGPVTPFVVAQCVVNDGYQTVRTFFSYETESALFDSQRLAPRFEKVTIAVGSGLNTLSSASISGGWTEYYLYSGRYGGPSTSLPATEFTPAGNANTYPALVTGQTYYQRIVSGANSAAIQTIATHWNVFALPSQTGGTAYQLRSIKAVETIDGVSKTLSSTFDLPDGTPHTGQYTGLLIGVTSSNVNATGQAEQLQTTYTYGYQVYPALLQKNILSPIVQTAIVRQQGNPLATVTTDVSVITWHIDPTLPPAPSATYRWLGTGSSTFTAWTSATPVSADWLKTSAITSMVQGNLLEVQDAAGVSTSYLYDSQFLFPLARFANASVALGEAYYTGFESYENLNGWMQGTAAQVANSSTTTPIASGQLLSGSAATGNRCLFLTTGVSVAQALSASGPGYVGTMPSKWQTPGAQFVLTASYKTAPGFTSTSPNQSHVAVWYGTSCYPLNITNTDGKWVYQELRFTLPVTSQSPTNTLPILEITNDGGQNLSVDDIRLFPLGSMVMTQVYDPLYPIVIARMDANGLPKRYLYNDLQQPLAVIGPDQHINNLTATFFSRQQQIYNPDDRKHPKDPIGSTFLPNYPNSTLIATPQNGGSYFQFQDGDSGGWQGGSIQANALVLQAGATARLLRSGENFGLRMQLATLAQLGAAGGGLPTSLTIAIGTTQIVCNISSAGGAFLLQNNGQQLSSLTRRQVGTDWLVIALDALLLFYVDGEQIFATQLSANITGTIQISTQGPTGSGVGLRQVLLFADPLLSIHYRDGTGKLRQSQELENSTSIIVRETLYDAQGHSSIATLPVRKGTGAQAPQIFGFEPDFVTGRDPGSGDNLWSGNSSNTRQGFMSGLIQSWLESDYQTNFPYVRQIYAPVPLPRVVATTGSHQAYSVGSPHVTTFQYGLSSSVQTLLQSLALTGQSQNYGALTSYAPIDNSTQIASVSIWDKYGNTVANGAVAGNDFKLTSYARSYQNTEPQMTLTTRLPNFYENQATQTNFQLIESYNHPGEAVARQTPDSQNTIAIYDMCGRRSFALTPTGAEQNPNLILYWKYDQLGRTTEAGYLSAAWNVTTLQQLAYGQSTIWPAQPVWLKKFWYDCDYTGSITNMKGYVAEVMSRNAQPGQTGLDPASFVIYQRYTYDAWGRIRTQTLKVEEFTDLNYIISYTYDPIGTIASVTYPPVPGDATSFTVWYHYNQRGLLDKIGKAGTGNEAFYAAYTYNADGSLQNEVLNGGGTGSTNKITRTYHYNSMGWLLSTQDDHFLSETLNYQDQSGQYLDGNISQATYTFNMASNYGYSTPENYNETYTYDAFGQLLQVTNSLQSPGSLQIGDGAGNSYDANGNILAVSRGELPPTRYAYATGTDQLQTLEGGPETLTFQYNAGGAPTPWIYDCLTQIPLSVPLQSDAETRVEYRYGLGLTRVLKFVQGDAGLQQTLYVPGNQLFPLAEYDQAHGQITLHRRMIYGLRGLLAIDDGSHTYFHLKDHLGSTRLVFDEIRTVHTYLTYDAFGTLLSTNSSPDVSAAPFHYRFTGQEFEPETGLYHFPARLYNSNLGRFSTPDPAGQFASPYIYAGNNPVNFTDPTGMISLTGLRALGGLPPAMAHGLVAASIGAGIGAMVGGLKGMEIGLGAGFATGFGASLLMETFGVRLIRTLYANPAEYPLIFYNPDQLTQILGIRYNTGLSGAEMIAEYEGIPRRLWDTFLIPFNRENLGGVMAEAEQAGFRGRVILVAHRTGDSPPMVEVTGVQNLAGGELVGYLRQRGLAWQNVNRVDMSICNAARRFPGSPSSIAESFAWGIRLIGQEGDPVPSIRASIEEVTPWHPMFELGHMTTFPDRQRYARRILSMLTCGLIYPGAEYIERAQLINPYPMDGLLPGGWVQSSF